MLDSSIADVIKKYIFIKIFVLAALILILWFTTEMPVFY
jgi:hypothetical protein